MSTLTVRNVDDNLKSQLRLRAARQGRSMEEEVRQILRQTLGGDNDAPRYDNLADGIAAIFDPLGGVNLDLPERQPMREPPDFSGPEYDTYDRS